LWGVSFEYKKSNMIATLTNMYNKVFIFIKLRYELRVEGAAA
jgi:hypothetical protein